MTFATIGARFQSAGSVRIEMAGYLGQHRAIDARDADQRRMAQG